MTEENDKNDRQARLLFDTCKLARRCLKKAHANEVALANFREMCETQHRDIAEAVYDVNRRIEKLDLHSAFTRADPAGGAVECLTLKQAIIAMLRDIDTLQRVIWDAAAGQNLTVTKVGEKIRRALRYEKEKKRKNR